MTVSKPVRIVDGMILRASPTRRGFRHHRIKHRYTMIPPYIRVVGVTALQLSSAQNVMGTGIRNECPMSFLSLSFNLDIVDGWPPVAVEGLVFTNVGVDCYRLEVPPFFIKDLSVGDVLNIETSADGFVSKWTHEFRSLRSTIWIMDWEDPNLEMVVAHLLSRKCNVERFKQYKYLSLDVPSECSQQELEFWLDKLDEEKASVAYPSYRHEPD